MICIFQYANPSVEMSRSFPVSPCVSVSACLWWGGVPSSSDVCLHRDLTFLFSFAICKRGRPSVVSRVCLYAQKPQLSGLWVPGRKGVVRLCVYLDVYVCACTCGQRQGYIRTPQSSSKCTLSLQEASHPHFPGFVFLLPVAGSGPSLQTKGA